MRSKESLEPAHVKKIEDGLRHVERQNFESLSEVDNFLHDFFFLNIGLHAIVYRHVSQEVVARISTYSILGFEWTLSRLYQLALETPEPVPSYVNETITRLKTFRKFGYWVKARKSSQDVVQRTAAHNAQFRRDPGSTVPINKILELNGVPFGFVQRFLEGEAGQEEPAYWQKVLAYDINPANVITNIRNSLAPSQLIDIRTFIASDERLK